MEPVLTKRELIASMAMQAMVSDHTHSLNIIPELAVELADNLIKELDESLNRHIDKAGNNG